MNHEVRPITGNGCHCKFCGKSIPKAELASVFSYRSRGQFHPVHMHLDCVVELCENTQKLTMEIKPV